MGKKNRKNRAPGHNGDADTFDPSTAEPDELRRRLLKRGDNAAEDLRREMPKDHKYIDIASAGYRGEVTMACEAPNGGAKQALVLMFNTPIGFKNRVMGVMKIHDRSAYERNRQEGDAGAKNGRGANLDNDAIGHLKDEAVEIVIKLAGTMRLEELRVMLRGIDSPFRQFVPKKGPLDNQAVLQQMFSSVNARNLAASVEWLRNKVPAEGVGAMEE